MTTNKTPKIYRFLITGQVQGVGYRAFVFKLAQRYRLTGSARNLSSGGVEVLLATPDDLIDEIKIMLKRGPPLAIVTAVTSELADHQNLSGFQIL